MLRRINLISWSSSATLIMLWNEMRLRLSYLRLMFYKHSRLAVTYERVT